MKIKTLIQAQQSLKNLAEIKFDSDVRFKLKSIYKRLGSEIETFTETRNELVKSLGAFEEKLQTWKVLPEKMPAFFKEEQKLLEVEIDLVIEKFPRSTLEGKEISVADDINLEFLFEDAEQ